MREAVDTVGVDVHFWRPRCCIIGFSRTSATGIQLDMLFGVAMREPPYKIRVSHPGLGKYRIVSGTNKRLVKAKADALCAQWDAQYQAKLAREQAAAEKALLRAQVAYEKATGLSEAERLTAEAETQITEIDQLLLSEAAIDTEEAWENLKHHESFDKPRPRQPKPMAIPDEPTPEDIARRFGPGWLDRFLASRKKARQEKLAEIYETNHAEWVVQKDEINAQNEKRQKEFRAELASWEQEESDFDKAQQEHNASVDERRRRYLVGHADTVVEHCELVLDSSSYPDCFPRVWDMEYSPETRVLVVDYSLPAPQALPRIKEVKYVQSKGEFRTTELTEATLRKLYESLVYQTALRTVDELFTHDEADALDMVVFNGWVESIDRATGKVVNPCIVSLPAKKEDLSETDLANVDPKACFKRLRGVGSADLHTVAPVAPVLTANRGDRRFVSSYPVAQGIDDSVNLAAIDWQDFEHLIRELFEQEFAVNGGEVKVTQASRDGGVDAVAFDPDPIRGGKIVIQAKRYTNVVGVAAVRDLFGTVHNEGAIKGILVTTSDYGADAYEFARGKPLTLLNGGNLLHLLEKHGHRARIDLKEARMMLAEQERHRGRD